MKDEGERAHGLRTRCCVCGCDIRFAPSISMQLGANTGHLTCPDCKAFLHVEVLEGNDAWSERWEDYIQREQYGVSFVQQATTAKERID